MWAPDYVTSAELAKVLNITDTDDDFSIALAITSASRAVDQCAGRQFGRVDAPEARYYTPEFDRRCRKWFVEIDDTTSDPEDMTVLYGGQQFTDFTMEPFNAVAKGKVYERIVFGQRVSLATEVISVTDMWGWPASPPSVKQATLIQAARFLARKDSPYGVAGSPSDGSETRLLAKVDPDVAVILKPFRRQWWAA